MSITLEILEVVVNIFKLKKKCELLYLLPLYKLTLFLYISYGLMVCCFWFFHLVWFDGLEA